MPSESDVQLLQVVAAIAEWTGIVLHQYHYPMLEYELTKLADDSDLRRGATLVLRGDSAARRKLISVISNSETYLFRHWGHFEALRRCAEQRLVGGRPFSVLSAGCSSGEECWSAAAVVASVYLSAGCENFSVRGWDIDPERLSRARSGVYGPWATRKGLHGYDPFFEMKDKRCRVTNTLRRFVEFAAVNLVGGEWPCHDRFDAILFRNVSIYWNRQKANSVKDRLVSLLADDGILLLGPSDPVELDNRQWSVETGSGAPVFRKKAKAPVKPEQDGRKRTMVHVQPKRADYQQKSKHTKRSAPPRTEPRIAVAEKAEVNLNSTDVEDLANRGQYEAALATLSTRGSSLPPAQKLLEGILLLNLDRTQEAIKVFRHCVFLEPKDPSYRRWLAVALDAAGYKNEAAREYRNARNIEVEL